MTNEKKKLMFIYHEIASSIQGFSGLLYFFSSCWLNNLCL